MFENYIESCLLQFRYYKKLGEQSIHQLSDEELFFKEHDNDNSIANICFHLYGNMMSRWTDFLVSDGEKQWRERDKEFEDIIQNRVELLSKWEEGWKCVFDALEKIDPSQESEVVYIRNIGHSLVEAINRQLCHYAYHVGQIVFAAKSMKQSEWQSLSIPKGKSQDYNKEKFKKDRHRGHFSLE